MKVFKKGLVWAVMLVMLLACVPEGTASAAAVKLNVKRATIYEGETVQLKLKGASKVSWTSSAKKVATVSKKGLVRAVKAGSCKITAKNKKTGKTYICKITVKAVSKETPDDNDATDDAGTGTSDESGQSGKKTLDIHDMFISDNGARLWFRVSKSDKEYSRSFGTMINENARFYLDGKLVEGARVNYISSDISMFKLTFATWLGNTSPVEAGSHTFKIEMDGYEDFEYSFTYSVPTTLLIDGMVHEGPIYCFKNKGQIRVSLNNSADISGLRIYIDGTEIKTMITGNGSEIEIPEVYDRQSHLLGDYDLCIRVNVSAFGDGKHILSVQADGYPEEQCEFEL